MLTSRHLIVKENEKIVEADIELPTNDEIPEGTVIDFLSKDEIANDLVDRVLSGEDKVDIITKSPVELNGLSNSLGSFIRNTYGLWLNPHPYVNSRKSSADNASEKVSLEIIQHVLTRLAE